MELEVISLASSSPIHKLFIIIFAVLLAVCLIMPVCIFISWNHIYESQKSLVTPYNFPGSIWKSDRPKMVLEVAKDSSIPSDSKCYIECEGTQLDVVFSPGYPQRATVALREAEGLEIQDIRLLICDATFSEDKVTLKLIQDNLFNGDYKTITLKRIS